MNLRKFLRGAFDLFVRIFGTTLNDYRTGEKIAKAVVLCWNGHIYVLGLQGKDQVIPLFLPQDRITFWKRKIGFTVHPAPDFPSEPRAGAKSPL
jgi:hypothetical protein